MKDLLEKRPFFVLLGVSNFFLFHYSIYRLWFFLYDTRGRVQSESLGQSILVNTLLILFFTVPHSLLLQSKIKTKILKIIPSALYGTFYSIHACLAIDLLDNYWIQMRESFFVLSSELKLITQIFYASSWLFMLYAMISTGLFRQSGIEQWWKALKGEKYKPTLSMDGAYSFCRHPIYAAFLGMIWFSPFMNVGHLYLSISWTVYILVGMRLKEKRLMRNKKYQNYAKQVPAFPLLPKLIDNFISMTNGSKQS